MEDALWSAIERLAPLRPEFVSVTYGAGGSTRERTHATVARILRETDLKPAAHLTCVAATKEEVDAVARDYWDARRPPHRGAARRFRRRPRQHVRAASRRLRQRGRSRRRPQENRALRDFRRRLSREASRKPVACRRHGQPQGQGRCRRRPHHHAVRLRQHALPALPRARARRRHLGTDHARHRADPQLQAGGELCRQGRCQRALVARAPLRRA